MSRILTVILSLALATPLLAGQKPEARAVKISTGDGVILAGRFFAGQARHLAPAVLVLDEPGDAAQPRVCDAIARTLVEKGCAVFCFDYRGQGGSTEVEPSFWRDATNRRFVVGAHLARPPETIRCTDFRPGYLPRLIDDIATARAYLGRRHDARECCVQQLFVVGLGRGATLGQIWLGLEGHRHAVTGLPARLDPTPESRDIAGCLWIDPQPTLDQLRIPFAEILQQVRRAQRPLVGILHSGARTPAGRLALQVATPEEMPKKTVVAREIAGDPEVPLTRRPATLEQIKELHDGMVKVLDAPLWERRDYGEQTSVWSFPEVGPVVAKEKDRLHFAPAPIGLYLGRFR